MRNQGFRGRIPELDGLRAVGMALVLVNHCWPRAASPTLWDLGLLAWIAMDSFFVLSGFLIAGILLDTRGNPDYYRSYYLRRSLRIFPPYYGVLALLTCAMALRGSLGQALGGWESPLWYFLYLGNFAVAAAGVWPSFPGFTPLWSLQVEEQFYLLLPPAIRRVRTETLSRILWTLVLVSPLVRLALYVRRPDNPYPLYVLLPCHMEGLALGVLIAIRFRAGAWDLRRGPLTALTIGLLAVTCVTSFWSNPARSNLELFTPFNRLVGYSLSSVACACLVLWLIRFRGSKLTWCLRIPPVQYLGRISYGVYLIHLPVRETIFLLRHRLGWELPRESFEMFALVVVATLACASASWFALERPLLRLQDRLAPRARRSDPGRAIPSASHRDRTDDAA